MPWKTYRVAKGVSQGVESVYFYNCLLGDYLVQVQFTFSDFCFMLPSHKINSCSTITFQSSTIAKVNILKNIPSFLQTAKYFLVWYVTKQNVSFLNRCLESVCGLLLNSVKLADSFVLKFFYPQFVGAFIYF